MKILITGICGFVGSTIANTIVERGLPWKIAGIDNLIRRGSESNLTSLNRRGIQVHHGDLRCQSDIDALPDFDFLIDAAANPSVLAGADGKTSSRQLMEHNLCGTINLLERCKACQAGFILLSTSRVYSIPPLANLPVIAHDGAYHLQPNIPLPNGISQSGISESFSTGSPISLYGASKLASESIALEYGATFDFPVWINRSGVLAGAGQFGRPDQGIYAYWLNAHLRKKPLKYIGFDGQGHQVRDCLHPRDLVELIEKQVAEPKQTSKPRLSNVSGGIASAKSLSQLTAWCNERFGKHKIERDPTPRAFDVPWIVLDAQQAKHHWGWHPQTTTHEILSEIATHAEQNQSWLEIV